jgi:tRNA threonylcarbamoyladenosine biosynthesis protein TsaE
MKQYIACDLGDLKPIAKQLLNDFKQERVFAFKAEMGAGKTTFIKAICEELKVETIVNSPTFAIVNSYFSDIVGEIYHFDFYRLKDECEAFDIGFEEYIDSGRYCFIEWVEKVENLLPPKYVLVQIQEKQEGERQIKAEIEYCQ